MLHWCLRHQNRITRSCSVLLKSPGTYGFNDYKNIQHGNLSWTRDRTLLWGENIDALQVSMTGYRKLTSSRRTEHLMACRLTAGLPEVAIPVRDSFRARVAGLPSPSAFLGPVLPPDKSPARMCLYVLVKIILKKLKISAVKKVIAICATISNFMCVAYPRLRQ